MALGVAADAGDASAVEFGEGEAFEGLVPAASDIAEHCNGDGFAEGKRVGVIVAPVDGRVGAAHAYICREFIHFTADGELVDVGARVGDKGDAVFAGLGNVEAGDGREGGGIVEPSLDDGGAGSGYGGVALAVGGVLGAAFGEGVGHEVGIVSGEGAGEGFGIEHVLMDGITGLAGFGHVDEAAVFLRP